MPPGSAVRMVQNKIRREGGGEERRGRERTLSLTHCTVKSKA
jgi:hypothetical protein